MLTDRYGLALTTTSAAARDAYVEGCDLLLSIFPGATAALDRAIAADPDFALAHIARARSRQTATDLAGMRESLAAAESVSAGLPARDLSHIAVFRLLFAGQPAACLAAVRAHLDQWPRDAVVLSLVANQGGLIGMSGLAGREHNLAALLTKLAPHYGDDWFFNCHYGMALSEVSRQAEARPIIERSLAAYKLNAYGAHALAHCCYETGKRDEAIAFMKEWLPCYHRDGALYGHLAWHLAIFELQAGNMDACLRLYHAAFSAPDHRGAAQQKLNDTAAFLWRSELAGHPRDPGKWAVMLDFVREKFPRPGQSIADWHAALVYAANAEYDALDAWIDAIEDLDRAGRYASGTTVPAAARAFAAFQRGDYATVIDRIVPMLTERERIGGSRAQVDLIEFTLLASYLRSGRQEDARRLRDQRRPGGSLVPVAGLN